MLCKSLPSVFSGPRSPNLVCLYICSRCEMYQSLEEVLWGEAPPPDQVRPRALSLKMSVQVSMTRFKAEMTAVLTPPPPDHLSTGCRNHRFLL